MMCNKSIHSINNEHPARDINRYNLGNVSKPVMCVKIGKGMQSNTTVSIKVYLMAILDNHMFRPLLKTT